MEQGRTYISRRRETEGGQRAKSLSRITQAASHQAKEIIGGNEVLAYKVCVSLYSAKGKKTSRDCGG